MKAVVDLRGSVAWACRRELHAWPMLNHVLRRLVAQHEAVPRHRDGFLAQDELRIRSRLRLDHSDTVEPYDARGHVTGADIDTDLGM